MNLKIEPIDKDQLSENDVYTLNNIFKSKQFIKHVSGKKIDSCTSYLDNVMNKFVVTRETNTNQIVTFISYGTLDISDESGIIIATNPKCLKKGLATLSLELFKQYIIDYEVNISKLIAVVNYKNYASLKLLEKSNFKLENDLKRIKTKIFTYKIDRTG